ncbi:hypothetical protein [Streptomyces sp. NPDC058373]|uniref:hypothetical protein n=1 Tax=Streptomyces sp. NPDC058373 TaxID=3346465 RepID=UPI0036698262
MTVCLIKSRHEDIVQAVVAAVDLEWHEALGPESGWSPQVCAAYADSIARAAARAAELAEVPAEFRALLQGGTDA